MRILHIMAGRGHGGAETYSTDVMLSLHQAGVDQRVVMAADAPRFVEMQGKGLRMAPAVLAVPFRFLQRLRVRRLIAQENPDIIHCWMRRAASLIPATDRATIGWFGGYYEPRHFRHCRDFVGVTRDIARHMVAKGIAPEHAHYIPTFPDIVDAQPVSRATLETPPDAPVLLALSRLHPKKGLDILLRATAKLPGVYVWLAGDGPLDAELKALTAELKIEGRVRFLGWRTDRAALLRAADICVLPSRYEPFGTVILEAWAAQTPLVACRSAGPAGHIADGVDGLLVDIDDVDGLASALLRVIENPELRRNLIESGYQTYQQGYTQGAVTAQWMNFYQELLRRGKGHGYG